MSSSLRALANIFRSTTASKPASVPFKPSSKPASVPFKPATKPASVPPKPAANPASVPPKPAANPASVPPKLVANPAAEPPKKFKRLAAKLKHVSNPDDFRIQRVNDYVERLAAANQHSLIEQVVQYQKQAGDINDESFANKLISMYGRSGMFDNAHQLLDEIPVKTCKSLNALLAASVYAKKCDRTEELFREVPNKFNIRPDVMSYNILIKSYTELGSLDLALNVIDKMESAGLKPDIITINTLLAGAYQENRVDEAEKLWLLMETKNLVPTARSYDPKMKYLLKMDKVSELVVLFEEMKSKGIKLDRHSNCLLIKKFCEFGDLEETKRWYYELELHKVRLDRKIVKLVVLLACEEDEIDFAYKVAKGAIKWKIILQATVLQDVVNKLVKASKIDKAEELIALASKLKYYNQKLKLPVCSVE